ncbi:hypothetical protein F7734_07620 [Scytonema sp. UIC 10036]|uniref:hypothetical protein n=1 Tax=Scytonema sp. UIC 10036 TaxID=2304196 RepID=UPI0012DA28D9|nr:hypothetical protein [Scytonema sp. UIC 10036]MUG92330.1 hypothetical protein [Scytonema sp. UIC 10036]
MAIKRENWSLKFQRNLHSSCQASRNPIDDEIEAIAKDEKRSMSQMVKLLVEYAIASRQEKVKDKSK